MAVAVPWKNRIGINQTGSRTRRYRNGAHRKIIPDATSSRFLPRWSDKTPIGKENSMPASGEKTAMRPIIAVSAPIACEKRGNTGVFAIVVEKIAKNPRRKK